MKIENVLYEDLGEMYAVYPDGPRISCYENTLITVLLEDSSLAGVKRIVEDPQLSQMIDHQRILMLFPKPRNEKWDTSLDVHGQDEMHRIMDMVTRFNSRCKENDFKPYHNMHNARYYMGVGSGATLVQSIAAIYPVNVAGIFTIGGGLSHQAMSMSVREGVPAILWNAPEDTVRFFKKMNRTDREDDGFACCSRNDVLWVRYANAEGAMLDAAAVMYGWEHLFSKVCRMNAGFYGQLFPRTVRDDYVFCCHEHENTLGDGKAHSWFEFIPGCVRQNPEQKVPLLMFLHGGGDSPANIANSIKLYELAEEENFILVHPAATDDVFWNQDMDPKLNDDCGYLEKLLDYLVARYPIDTTRIYMGGFSNGSSMAQVFSFTHPDRVAAVFANNSAAYTYTHTHAFDLAAVKKQEYDYRMPVWYTYGSRDLEFPATRGSGQQNQYDFWKGYNNITVKQTPYRNEPDANGVGVTGDKVEVYQPSRRYPETVYMTHRFYSNDPEKWNLYNYTLAIGKGHDSVPYEARLGWNYIRQWRRLPDKRLEFTPNGEWWK